MFNASQVQGVQGEVVLKWFKTSKRSVITVNISFHNIRNETLYQATCWDQVEAVQQADL